MPPSKKYRYCDVCRGDDKHNLISCNECGRKCHIECLQKEDYNVDKLIIDSSVWRCIDCVENIQAKSLSTDRIQIIKAFHHDILRSRAAFFQDQKSFLEPFCSSKDRLNKLINKYKTSKSNNNYQFLLDECINELNKNINPSYIKGELRPYQFEGVSKIFSWFSRGIGGILADEMGLGKTLQTITVLAIMKHKLGVAGPHLIITPLAVLQNWANELHRFAPSLTFKKIYGSITERSCIINDNDVLSGNYDIYLTTYETVMCEESFFSDSWTWATICIDEGHRIKNENAKLRHTLNRLRCPLRILLTGTPVQNDLHELWALLNYILPEVFESSKEFDEGAKIRDDSVNHATCKRARDILEQFMMIRRVKRDVETSLLPKKYCALYVHMTDLQKRWYQSVVTQDGFELSLMTSAQFMNCISQLNKIVNHPKQILLRREIDRQQELTRMSRASYSGSQFIKPRLDLLAPDPNSDVGRAEAELRSLRGEALVQSSAKLATLDRLLLRLKIQKSRVLIFSQWKETLDILQEYMNHRFGSKSYLRLDGETNSIIREIDVRKFNSDMSVFAYLISTKAGGMGINLATADTVILYDSCWNPQVDLQAQDRAHRIGQKKQVTVFRLITSDSYEEVLHEMAERKLILNHMIISSGTTDNTTDTTTTSGNLLSSSSSTLISSDKTNEKSNNDKHKSNNKNLIDSNNSDDIDSEEVLVGDDLNQNMTEQMTLTQMRHVLGFGIDKIKYSPHSGHTMTAIEIDQEIDAAINGKAPVHHSNLHIMKQPVVNSSSSSLAINPSKGNTNNNKMKIEIKKATATFHDPIVIDDSSDSESDEDDNTVNLKDNIKDRSPLPPRSFGLGLGTPVILSNTDISGSSSGINNKNNNNNNSTKSVTSSSLSSSSNSNDNMMIIGSKSASTNDLLSLSSTAQAEATAMEIADAATDGTSTNAELNKNNNDNEISYSETGRPRRSVKEIQRYQPPLTGMGSSTNKKKVKKTREDFCFECKDGGTLIECTACPKAYHMECLGLTAIPKKAWFCPWHTCIECDRSSSNSGGMQFRCMTCPITYCFDCFPKDIPMENKEPPLSLRHSFATHGFEIPKSSLFFECLECKVTREEKEAKQKEIMQKLAEQRKEEAKKRKDKEMELYLQKGKEIREQQLLQLQKQREMNQRLQYLEMLNRNKYHAELNGNMYQTALNHNAIVSEAAATNTTSASNINTGTHRSFMANGALNQPSSRQYQHHLQQMQAAGLLVPKPSMYVQQHKASADHVSVVTNSAAKITTMAGMNNTQHFPYTSPPAPVSHTPLVRANNSQSTTQGFCNSTSFISNTNNLTVTTSNVANITKPTAASIASAK